MPHGQCLACGLPTEGPITLLCPKHRQEAYQAEIEERKELTAKLREAAIAWVDAAEKGLGIEVSADNLVDVCRDVYNNEKAIRFRLQNQI